jgi:hypothetical protein
VITRGRKPRLSLRPPEEYIGQRDLLYDGWEDDDQAEELPDLWRPEEVIRTRQCKKCRAKFLGRLSLCSDCSNPNTSL